MAFTQRKRTTDKEKAIVAGFIISNEFAKQMRSIIKLDLIKSSYLKQILLWALDYYDQHDKVIEDTIYDVLDGEKENNEDIVNKQIEAALNELNDIFFGKPFNVEYHTKNSENYLQIQSYIHLKNRLEAAVLNESLEDAQNALNTFKKVEKPIAKGIDILYDDSFIPKIFEKMDNIINIPGAIGEYIGDIYRGDLVGIGGVMKAGKTWTLMEFAKWSLYSQKNIAYFTVEMKDHLMARRLFQGFCGRNKKTLTNNLSISYYDKETKTMRLKFYKPKNAMDEHDVILAQKRLKKRAHGAKFKLYDLSNSGGNVEAISNILDTEEYFTGFIPDVIIVDYADILRPERDSPQINRDRLNHTWLNLKWVAQNRNCAVITASQLGRAGLTRDAGLADISDDIRKFAHVSLWISINKNKEEHALGLIRMKVDGRHEDFSTNDEVVCTQCLTIGKPIIQSVWKNDIINYADYIGAGKEKEEKT